MTEALGKVVAHCNCCNNEQKTVKKDNSNEKITIQITFDGETLKSGSSLTIKLPSTYDCDPGMAPKIPNDNDSNQETETLPYKISKDSPLWKKIKKYIENEDKSTQSQTQPETENKAAQSQTQHENVNEPAQIETKPRNKGLLSLFLKNPVTEMADDFNNLKEDASEALGAGVKTEDVVETGKKITGFAQEHPILAKVACACSPVLGLAFAGWKLFGNKES